jgi:hypothetical protein
VNIIDALGEAALLGALPAFRDLTTWRAWARIPQECLRPGARLRRSWRHSASTRAGASRAPADTRKRWRSRAGRAAVDWKADRVPHRAGDGAGGAVERGLRGGHSGRPGVVHLHREGGGPRVDERRGPSPDRARPARWPSSRATTFYCAVPVSGCSTACSFTGSDEPIEPPRKIVVSASASATSLPEQPLRHQGLLGRRGPP